jgi:hypothetical protein
MEANRIQKEYRSAKDKWMDEQEEAWCEKNEQAMAREEQDRPNEEES